MPRLRGLRDELGSVLRLEVHAHAVELLDRLGYLVIKQAPRHVAARLRDRRLDRVLIHDIRVLLLLVLGGQGLRVAVVERVARLQLPQCPRLLRVEERVDVDLFNLLTASFTAFCLLTRFNS